MNRVESHCIKSRGVNMKKLSQKEVNEKWEGWMDRLPDVWKHLKKITYRSNKERGV